MFSKTKLFLFSFFFSKDEIKLTNAQQSVCIFSRCCNLITAEDIPKNEDANFRYCSAINRYTTVIIFGLNR